ncbi:MAG TPA: prephenate dehydrogenase/arogenate dehydrogenase family protein [Anaerolineales bacterium]|nr:prephenate dehydrogenase/arogenate dehydrogenase family protein [Anaerolineales bacterium]
MAADILIIGLGETGASIGLALARSGGDFRRTGYDPNLETARAAQKSGAVDRLTSNPRLTASQADLIIHSLNPAALGPGLENLVEDMKPDALLVDTTSLKQSILSTIPARLKPGASFVGAVPILGAEKVFHVGAIEPSADLYAGGLLALVLPPGTPSSAVEVCTDLATLLGATPFFLEAAELDAAVAAAETLPVVVAAAYLRSLAASPGWRDQGQLAARAFNHLTRLAASRPAAEIAEDLAANRSNIIRWIDSLLSELEAIRGIVARADAQDLSRRFEEALTTYETWQVQRRRGPAEFAAPMPEGSTGSAFARLLGLRRPRKPGAEKTR